MLKRSSLQTWHLKILASGTHSSLVGTRMGIMNGSSLTSVSSVLSTIVLDEEQSKKS